jgi:hypothetical protein
MANQRLFPEPEGEKRAPKKRFDEAASKIFSVPKSEIDEREKKWQQSRHKPKRA